MDSTSVSHRSSTKNKGIDVRLDSFPVRTHKNKENTSSLSSSSNHLRSLTDIKNQIQNALDTMGPSTLSLDTTTPLNTSTETDNEDLVFQTLQKNQQKQKVSKNLKYPSSPRKESLMVDPGTPTLNSVESLEEEVIYTCCSHNLPPPCISHRVECMCIHNANNVADKKCKQTIDCKKRGLMEWMKQRSFELMAKKSTCVPCELYKLNICNQSTDGCAPKRVMFELVEGIPKPSQSNVATNTIKTPIQGFCHDSKKILQDQINESSKELKNLSNLTQYQNMKKIYFDCNGNARMDFYYFDHGNSQYLNTTDTAQLMKCEIIAEITERKTTKFWAEVFASIHIGLSFCVSFVLQLFKFFLYSILRPLSVGLVQMASDYFFKPFLTICFNGIIQPFLIFLYNIATSLRDLCDPIAEACGFFFKEIAVLLKAIRLCTYKRVHDVGDLKNRPKCEC